MNHQMQVGLLKSLTLELNSNKDESSTSQRKAPPTHESHLELLNEDEDEEEEEVKEAKDTTNNTLSNDNFLQKLQEIVNLSQKNFDDYPDDEEEEEEGGNEFKKDQIIIEEEEEDDDDYNNDNDADDDDSERYHLQNDQSDDFNNDLKLLEDLINNKPSLQNETIQYSNHSDTDNNKQQKIVRRQLRMLKKTSQNQVAVNYSDDSNCK
jgi:hypothetical protein